MAKRAKRVFGAAIALGAVVAGLGEHTATAGTASSNFSVTATVIATCTISTTTFAFGNYDPLSGTALDATNNVTLTCSKGTAWSLDLNEGLNAGAGSTPAVPVRRMSGGTEFLNYGFYSDPARTLNWGTPTNRPSGTAANKNPFTVPIYGRVPSGQDNTTGAYSDTIQATVNF